MTTPAPSHRVHLADRVAATYQDQGYVTFRPADVDLDDDLELVKERILEIMVRIATPIVVFERHGQWREIGVKPDRELHRSEGVGASPLHMDFVNSYNPPDLLCLYCVRNDAGGGGVTTLAPTACVDALSSGVAQHLARRVFSDGKMVDLANIGHDVNPFRVLNVDEHWRVRYTDNLLGLKNIDKEAKGALERLSAELNSEVREIPLTPGDVIFVDQRRYVHGKTPLSARQRELPSASQRLLLQAFGRAHDNPLN